MRWPIPPQQKLRERTVPTFNQGRYFLLEFPHYCGLPHLESLVFNLLAAGYVPVIAHPERLRWINQGYEMFKRLVGNGAWMQFTAGSLTGRFGKSAKSSLQNQVCKVLCSQHGRCFKPLVESA